MMFIIMVERWTKWLLKGWGSTVNIMHGLCHGETVTFCNLVSRLSQGCKFEKNPLSFCARPLCSIRSAKRPTLFFFFFIFEPELQLTLLNSARLALNLDCVTLHALVSNLPVNPWKEIFNWICIVDCWSIVQQETQNSYYITIHFRIRDIGDLLRDA